jgi:penicillin-binding protein 2
LKRRFVYLSIFIGLLLLILIGRLAKIQIAENDKYKEISSGQSLVKLDGFGGRGNIYDREDKPLTGMEERFIIIIEKRKIDKRASELIKKTGGKKVNNIYNNRYHIYSTLTLDREVYEILKKEYATIALKTKGRYSENQPAVHVIGYINKRDKTGVCGIEKDYDEVLSSLKKVYYGQVDGRGYLIPGMGIKTEKDNRDWGVLTTLDLELQKSAEEVLKAAGVKGVIIISDANSGELLVSASSPAFNPYQVEEYLGSNEKEFLNKATNCKYPPGSIFKIIVAAAALKKGVVTPQTVFHCNGYHEVEGIKVKCSTGGANGHGEITFGQAFEESCNAVFVQVGQLVGSEEIIKIALDFGLSKEAVENLSGQETGNLPTIDDVVGPGICNLSIGQGKLLVTPMQVQRITQIIANDGMDYGLSLIRGTVEGSKGTIVLPRQNPGQVIPQRIAKDIQQMMINTVQRGTADNMNAFEGITVGGKTGSAEASSVNKSFVHSWFTGFALTDTSKYVITVFVENGGSGRRSAVPIFEKMINNIYSN